MKRVLLEIYLPSAQRTFDVWVPACARLSQVNRLTAKAFEGLCGGMYTANGSSVLCDRRTGEIFNINMTVWELGQRNGSKLMLI